MLSAITKNEPFEAPLAPKALVKHIFGWVQVASRGKKGREVKERQKPVNDERC